jgi:hypothetical protein
MIWTWSYKVRVCCGKITTKCGILLFPSLVGRISLNRMEPPSVDTPDQKTLSLDESVLNSALLKDL